MDRRIKCTLIKFFNNTKLCGMVDILEGRDAIQSDRLQRWAYTNLMKLNKVKCKVLHLSWCSPKHKYSLSGK